MEFSLFELTRKMIYIRRHGKNSGDFCTPTILIHLSEVGSSIVAPKGCIRFVHLCGWVGGMVPRPRVSDIDKFLTTTVV